MKTCAFYLVEGRVRGIAKKKKKIPTFNLIYKMTI